MKKKNALIAVKTHNYGSLLQTYALQKFLFKNGYDNEIILYKEKNYFKYLKLLFKFSFLRLKFKQTINKIILKIFFTKISKKLKLRIKSFNNFLNNYLCFSNLIKSRNELIKSTSNYRAIVLGSDQVWHPNNLNMDFFNLLFVPDKIYKIAYAPSFGVSKIPKNQINKTKKYLTRINAISVREKSGQKIIYDLIKKDVNVVCDPTLLLTTDDWNEIKFDKKLIEEDYIFCYFLGDNKLHRQFANKFQSIVGGKIVNLPHLEHFNIADKNFGDYSLYNVSPTDFINLISNSKFVLTDSFHGTVFSIIYQKNFFTFNRFEEGNSNSTNSRISSFLGLLNLEHRRINGYEDPSTLQLNEISYENVNTKLNEFIQNSAKFLLDSLRSIKL